MGVTASIPVNIHHSIRLNLSTGVSTRTGSDYDVAGLIWQYRWGGGIPKGKTPWMKIQNRGILITVWPNPQFEIRNLLQ